MLFAHTGPHVGQVVAEVLYVNNLLGDDTFNARTAEPENVVTGPVRTIGRAIRLAKPGDTISIANTGIVYLESLSLTGARLSGEGDYPLTVQGNGAVIDGSRPVPPRSWRLVDGNIWRLVPWRKGHYQLILEDRPLTELRIQDSASTLPELPEGQWAAWRGAIYYHVPNAADPDLMPLRIAVEPVGLTLYAVRNVEIRDLTLRYFRLDGVNAHDLCEDVVLRNVRSIDNGRAGVTVAGSSHITLNNCDVTSNLRHSLLITEQATVEVVDSRLDVAPTEK